MFSVLNSKEETPAAVNRFCSASEMVSVSPVFDFSKLILLMGKYSAYQKDRRNLRWQELDCPTSFAIKCNNDILDYALLRPQCSSRFHM